MVPDPAMFSVDGVVFGLTSADVLFHLGKEELARQVVRTDRIKRLASHLIQQGRTSFSSFDFTFLSQTPEG